jgi:hypothetical protein
MESWCRICGDRRRATASQLGIAPAQTIDSERKLLDSNIMITYDLGGPCLFTAEKYINPSWLLLDLSIDQQASSGKPDDDNTFPVYDYADHA